MRTRFVTNAAIALAAGFLIVASRSFASGTTEWIAFGIGIGTLAIACLSQADSSRGNVQRALDGVIAVVGAWTIVASVVFHGATMQWLSTAEAIALVGLIFAGMTYDEVKEQAAVRSAAPSGMSDSLRAA